MEVERIFEKQALLIVDPVFLSFILSFNIPSLFFLYVFPFLSSFLPCFPFFSFLFFPSVCLSIFLPSSPVSFLSVLSSLYSFVSSFACSCLWLFSFGNRVILWKWCCVRYNKRKEKSGAFGIQRKHEGPCIMQYHPNTCNLQYLGIWMVQGVLSWKIMWVLKILWVLFLSWEW